MSLSRLSRRIIRSLAEVVLPSGDGAPTVSPAGVADFVDGYMPYLPTMLRVLFPVGLMLLEFGAFIFGPSLVPFSFMSKKAKQRYLEGWATARWRIRRELWKALKGLCLLYYYSQPEVGKAIGYTVAEHVELVSAERLRRHGSELR